MEKFSVVSLASKIPTEAAAYAYLEDLRWSGEPVCPHCGAIGGHYFLTPKNGVSRETSSGKQSERRTWKCCACRRQFSVTTGTVMHGSHIALRIWLFVFFEMAGNKNGIAAREIERKYGVTARTAWHMTQRIREAMNGGSLLPRMSGDIVADEAYIGGEPKNRHAKSRKHPAKRGRGTDKIAVLSLISSTTGEVRSHIIPNVYTETLRTVIARNVDMSESTLHTDTLHAYMPIGVDMAGHYRVDHSAGQYVTEKSFGTNRAEGYFSQLKRSLDGTHHHVSVKHLDRYLAEFDYRYSTCNVTDKDRMTAIVRKTAGKRLSYDDLRGPRSLSA